MKIKNNNAQAHIDMDLEVPFITFPVLSDLPFIRHAFSTKLGGVSKGIFSTMNLGTETSPYQDDPLNIIENFERISKSIGIDPKGIVVSHQLHNTNIMLVNNSDCGKGLYLQRDYENVDGLITNLPGITLVTKYADCVPLYIIDTKKKAIGLSHAGWRGTVGMIGLLTVKRMEECFGSNPKDMLAVIGPSICSDCYEVGMEVIEEFMKVFPEDVYSILFKKNPSGSYQLNLWEANRQILLNAGLNTDMIHISGVCTSCNDDLLFSHRKTNGKRGSLAAFLSII